MRNNIAVHHRDHFPIRFRISLSIAHYPAHSNTVRQAVQAHCYERCSSLHCRASAFFFISSTISILKTHLTKSVPLSFPSSLRWPSLNINPTQTPFSLDPLSAPQTPAGLLRITEKVAAPSSSAESHCNHGGARSEKKAKNQLIRCNKH